MKVNVYIELKESKSSGYASISNMFYEDQIENEYNSYVESSKMFGGRYESYEGYKLRHHLVSVGFDGRKEVKKDDIMKSLESQGLIYEVSEGGMFGACYMKTDELKQIEKEQFNKRKELVGVA